MQLFILFIACQQANVQSAETSPVLPLHAESIQQILKNRSIPDPTPINNGFQVPLETQYGTWTLSIQYFESAHTLYIAINDYLWLDTSRTAQTTVFAMSQMLTQNHSMLGGKFQINPQTGAITISTELIVIDGYREKEISEAIRRIISLAEENHPMITAALGGQFH